MSGQAITGPEIVRGDTVEERTCRRNPARMISGPDDQTVSISRRLRHARAYFRSVPIEGECLRDPSVNSILFLATTHLLMRRNISVSGGQGFDPIHLCPKGFTGIFQIIIRLKAKPESFRHTKEPGQPQGRIGGDGPLPLHDLIDPSGRNVNVFRQSVLAQIHGFKKLLKKNFSRMNRRIISHFSSPLLMIIDKQDQLLLDTGPSPGAHSETGARNTLVGGPRPDRSGFFVPRFFLPFGSSAFSCRACDEYNTRKGNKSAAPTAVSSARRPFRASPHRLEIDSRSLP